MIVATPSFISRRDLAHPIWPHIFLALYGAGWAISVDLGVKLYVAEIVSFIGIVLIRWQPIFRWYPRISRVLSAYCLWIAAMLASDFVNLPPIFDTLRSISTPVIGGIGLVFVAVALHRRPHSIITLLVAISVSKLIFGDPLFEGRFSDFTLSINAIFDDTNYFKVRVEPFISPLAVVASMILARWSLGCAGAFLFCVSIVYFSIDARSSGLAFLLSSVLCFLRRFELIHAPRRVALSAIIAFSVGFLLYVAYVDYTLTREENRHSAGQLQKVETLYNPISLLMVGRSEWLVIPAAALERPVFGWGSWARDEDLRFHDLRSASLDQPDRGRDIGDPSQNYIPVHSLVGSAWVWSGILGLASMFWLLTISLALIQKIVQVSPSAYPAVCYFASTLLWHYFFSPPQVVRLFYPIALAALIVLPTQEKIRCFKSGDLSDRGGH